MCVLPLRCLRVCRSILGMVLRMQAAQDPAFRHHNFDRTARCAVALRRSEAARRAAEASAPAEDYLSGVPLLEQSVKQTALAADEIAAFTDECASIARGLRCAMPFPDAGL